MRGVTRVAQNRARQTGCVPLRHDATRHACGVRRGPAVHLEGGHVGGQVGRDGGRPVPGRGTGATRAGVSSLLSKPKKRSTRLSHEA
jgi:hypothetical protein